MTIRAATARPKATAWYIICPVCRCRITLDGWPEPGGMEANIETCFECGTDIEVQPPKIEVINSLLSKSIQY